MKSTIGIKINEKILLDWINKHLWQYRLWRFKSRDTKLESLLPKNQLKTQSSNLIYVQDPISSYKVYIKNKHKYTFIGYSKFLSRLSISGSAKGKGRNQVFEDS